MNEKRGKKKKVKSKSETLRERLIWYRGYYTEAFDQVLEGLGDLIKVIENHDVAVAATNNSGVFWGRSSVLLEFCRIFNPILEVMAPYQSDVWCELAGNQITLPFNESSLLKDGISIADKLADSASDLGDLIQFKPEQLLDLRRNGGSLLLVSFVIRAIFENTHSQNLSWCNACFRRAHPNFDYCALHYSSTEIWQDTVNRKARRTAKSLDQELVNKWERHRSQRRLAGDNILLLSDDMPVPEIHAKDAYLRVPATTVDIVDATKNLPWTDVAGWWDEALNVDALRAVRDKLDCPSTYSSWECFVKSLYNALEDPVETTTHPLWVLYIMTEAEDWFAAEKELMDRRRKDTRGKVVDMYRQGMPPFEIARLLAVGEKYVVRILSSEGLEGVRNLL